MSTLTKRTPTPSTSSSRTPSPPLSVEDASLVTIVSSPSSTKEKLDAVENVDILDSDDSTDSIPSKVDIVATADIIVDSSKPVTKSRGKTFVDYDEVEEGAREFGATSGLLRFAADYKTLLWTFGIIPFNIILQVLFPSLNFIMLPITCYFALITAVVVHNHTHCPTFVSPILNNIFDCYLTCLYGYPVFAWHSTHKSSRGHHGFINKPGDPAPTWYLSNDNSNFIASSYFFVSSWLQGLPINDHIQQAKRRRHVNSKYYWILSQYASLVAFHFAFAIVCLSLYGNAGWTTYFNGLFIPSFFSVYSIMFINFVQHVHTDAHDGWNHSRNFTGFWLNFFLFNNGYHTAHHNCGGLHWSLLPAEHAKIEKNIDKELLVEDFNIWMFKSYALPWINSEAGTRQIGKNPWETDQPMPTYALLKAEAPLWGNSKDKVSADETNAPVQAVA